MPRNFVPSEAESDGEEGTPMEPLARGGSKLISDILIEAHEEIMKLPRTEPLLQETAYLSSPALVARRETSDRTTHFY